MSTVLEAKKRETGSRSILSEVRNNGGVPANVYGYKTESTAITVDARELAKIFHATGQNGVFKLSLDGKTVNAVVSEVQRSALKGHIRHIDFQAINMSEELEVDVPVVFIGEAVGAKEGGVLSQPNRDLKIKVKPSEIPESIEVDVSALNVGDTLSLADIREGIDYEVLNDDDYTLATVTPPTPPAEDVDPDAENITADDVAATGEKLDPNKPGRED